MFLTKNRLVTDWAENVIFHAVVFLSLHLLTLFIVTEILSSHQTFADLFQRFTEQQKLSSIF